MTTIRVRRFNPNKLNLGIYLEDFELDIKSGMTILDCLLEIKNKQDGSLTFRKSCRSGICGSCAVMINGVARLACKTQAMEVVRDGIILIEPLKNLPVIKDLVVDMDDFYKSIKEIEPWLKNDGSGMAGYGNKKKLEKVVDCIMCGVCWSACNVKDVDMDNSIFGPAAQTKNCRFICDRRDNTDQERIRRSFGGGLGVCTLCEQCDIFCPAEISRKTVVESMRKGAVDLGIVSPAHRNIAKTIKETNFALSVKETPTLGRHPGQERSFNGIEEIYVKEFDGKPKGEVVYFLGCMANLREQATADAIIKILQHNKIAAHIPIGQVCCGSPMKKTGFVDVAKSCMEKNIEIFNTYANFGIDTVLTGCPGCNSTMRKDYPEFSKEQELAINFRVYDMAEYMKEMADDGELNVALRIIDLKAMYHQPCHSIIDESVYTYLLKMLGVMLKELITNRGLCCGAGGGVRSGYPDWADKMAVRRPKKAVEEGAEAIITSCSFCANSFDGALNLMEETDSLKVIRFYELIAETYNL